MPESSFQPVAIAELAAADLIADLRQMLLMRHFEVRAESAYQHGQIGGFFHAYIGQEAIQVAAVRVLGLSHWYATSYRCHALALLLGATPNELMAELYGRASGNAKGRGGSMHFYTDRLLGGFGIVGGQIPIATGAAFSIKYQNKKNELAVCFMGDGAVAQGSFHESLNLAALWDLPCLYVIENNLWGMGTAIHRAISVPRLAEDKASGYGINGYTVDGMDYFSCYQAFRQLKQEVLTTSRPVLLEAVTSRFRGHSISDPATYRSKEHLAECMQRDPLIIYRNTLLEQGILTEEEYKAIDHEQREIVLEAMKYAENAPWPNLHSLEDDVLAP